MIINSNGDSQESECLPLLLEFQIDIAFAADDFSVKELYGYFRG